MDDDEEESWSLPFEAVLCSASDGACLDRRLTRVLTAFAELAADLSKRLLQLVDGVKPDTNKSFD